MTVLDERAVIMGMTATARSSSAAPPLSPDDEAGRADLAPGAALTSVTRDLIRAERDRAVRKFVFNGVCQECLKPMVPNPKRPTNRYCSKQCSNRAWGIARWRRDHR